MGRLLRSEGVSVHSIFVQAERAGLEKLVKLVEAGALSTRVAGTYALSEAATAYKLLAAGGVRGRLVLTP